MLKISLYLLKRVALHTKKFFERVLHAKFSLTGRFIQHFFEWSVGYNIFFERALFTKYFFKRAYTKLALQVPFLWKK